jgi:hypothetical protein
MQKTSLYNVTLEVVASENRDIYPESTFQQSTRGHGYEPMTQRFGT